MTKPKLTIEAVDIFLKDSMKKRLNQNWIDFDDYSCIKFSTGVFGFRSIILNKEGYRHNEFGACYILRYFNEAERDDDDMYYLHGEFFEKQNYLLIML